MAAEGFFAVQLTAHQMKHSASRKGGSFLLSGLAVQGVSAK